MKKFIRAALNLVVVSAVGWAPNVSFGQTAPASPVITVSNTLFVDPAGDDSTATRGTTKAYRTLAAALAASVSGDTVRLRPGSYPVTGASVCLQTLTIIGEGPLATTIVPDNSTTMRFSGGVEIRGINFDSGTNSSANTASYMLIDIGLSSNNKIVDCNFHGIGNYCIKAVGTKQSTFQNLSFDHVTQPVYVDYYADSNGTYLPSDLHFINCHSVNSLLGGFAIHGLNATGSAATVGGSVGVEFNNCSVKQATNNGAPAFEVQHGWTNIKFANCAAEDCTLGFSISESDHATLTTCTANNCTFLFEAANSHAVTFSGCIADSRPTPASSATPVTDSVVSFNSAAYDVQWVGGTVLNTYFQFYYSKDLAVTGTALRGSYVYNQDSNNVSIVDCTFAPLDPSAPAVIPAWLTIDCGTQNVAGVIFRGNHCYGGTVYSGVGMLGAYNGPWTVSGLNIIDNDTDGTYMPGGYFQIVGGTLVSHRFDGNTTLGSNGFPNDPPASSFPDSITLAPTALPATVTAGTIRFDGTHFYGGDGTNWKQLDNSNSRNN